MSQNEPIDNVSRRNVLKAAGAGAVGAGAAVLATPSAASAAGATFTAPTACAASGIPVLTALGPSTSTYNPPLSAIPQAVKVTINATFSERCDDNPSLLLVGLRVVANDSADSCTGEPLTTSSSGTLFWSDGTESNFTVNVATIVSARVNGQCVSKGQGTINAGAAHYAGAAINLMCLRKADSRTACLTGGTVSSASGYSIAEIVK